MYIHYIEHTFRFFYSLKYIYIHTSYYTKHDGNPFSLSIYISISSIGRTTPWKPEDYSHANRILEGLAPQPTKNDLTFTGG